MDITRSQLSGKTRTEHDLLGNKEIPVEFYFGVQTMRAIENFNISRVRLYFFPELIKALAMVKEAAAMANRDLGLIDGQVAQAIIEACEEVRAGKLDDHFVVDMVQGGAGTSTNMNANEVIANRALEILGHQRGEYKYCHPNNDVNMSQSTNDAYPTAVKIALINSISKLESSLKWLVEAFHAKGAEFAHIIKMGRTQLQDAVPMTLGQEFEAYAANLTEEVERLEQNYKLFLEVNMGATAIGTGINADPDYSPLCIKYLRQITGLPVVAATNMIEATNDTGAFIMNSSALKRLAVKLSKICNDPGKVNPVIPEVVNQVAFKVIGNDLTVTMAAEAGQLELNVMEPIIVHSLFESIDLLSNGMNTLRDRCVAGITANEEVCRKLVYNSIGLVTALNPYLGYETSTELAKTALKTGKGIYELVLEKKLMSQEELDNVLSPENMIKPRKFYHK